MRSYKKDEEQGKQDKESIGRRSKSGRMRS